MDLDEILEEDELTEYELYEAKILALEWLKGNKHLLEEEVKNGN